MLLLYFFAQDLQIYHVERMLPDMAQTTVIRFFTKMRDICSISLKKEKMFDEVEVSQHNHNLFITLIILEAINTCWMSADN